MALVGAYVALSRPLVAAIPVFLLAWLRFGIGAAAMAHWLRRPADEPPLDTRMRLLLFLESFLGNFLFSICMLFGVALTSALSAGVILASIPAAVAVMSWMFLRERVGARLWLAVAFAIGGIALLAVARHGSSGIAAASGREWLGNLLLVGAVLCEASYAVIGKRLAGTMTPRRIAAVINLWGFALATPLGIWAALRFDFGSVAGGTWLLLLFYSLAASVWTVWLWMTGLKGVPAAQAGIFTVMLPITAAAVGILVLGEPAVPAQLAALALALAGVVLATLPERKSPAQARR